MKVISNSLELIPGVKRGSKKIESKKLDLFELNQVEFSWNLKPKFKTPITAKQYTKAV